MTFHVVYIKQDTRDLERDRIKIILIKKDEKFIRTESFAHRAWSIVPREIICSYDDPFDNEKYGRSSRRRFLSPLQSSVSGLRSRGIESLPWNQNRLS